MSLSEEEFESWCFRNGGETFEEHDGPGLLCWFPDADVPDRVLYYPENETFDILTRGVFYETHSINQHTDAWIDEEDRLQIATQDVRLTVDPR